VFGLRALAVLSVIAALDSAWASPSDLMNPFEPPALSCERLVLAQTPLVLAIDSDIAAEILAGAKEDVLYRPSRSNVLAIDVKFLPEALLSEMEKDSPQDRHESVPVPRNGSLWQCFLFHTGFTYLLVVGVDYFINDGSTTYLYSFTSPSMAGAYVLAGLFGSGFQFTLLDPLLRQYTRWRILAVGRRRGVLVLVNGDDQLEAIKRLFPPQR
jgi:hypothetical protein